MAKQVINKSSNVMIIDNQNDIRIKAIRSKGKQTKKNRLFLDVDGTLVAMQYNPDFRNAKE
jgi:hypothetical protein